MRLNDRQRKIYIFYISMYTCYIWRCILTDFQRSEKMYCLYKRRQMKILICMYVFVHVCVCVSATTWMRCRESTSMSMQALTLAKAHLSEISQQTLHSVYVWGWVFKGIHCKGSETEDQQLLWCLHHHRRHRWRSPSMRTQICTWAVLLTPLILHQYLCTYLSRYVHRHVYTYTYIYCMRTCVCMHARVCFKHRKPHIYSTPRIATRETVPNHVDWPSLRKTLYTCIRKCAHTCKHLYSLPLSLHTYVNRARDSRVNCQDDLYNTGKHIHTCIKLQTYICTYKHSRPLIYIHTYVYICLYTS